MYDYADVSFGWTNKVDCVPQCDIAESDDIVYFKFKYRSGS